MQVVFMGAPEFAVPTLRQIASHGHRVVAVYTRAPQPGGRRGLAVQKTPVHLAAESLDIPVFTPTTLRAEEVQRTFRGHGADVGLVVAYGLLLPPAVLVTPRYGFLNIHASLLPRWRGAAPIQRAIMEGDRETGVMVMKMEEGLDTGPVALEDRLLIGPDVTAGEIHDQLALMGASLMSNALDLLEKGDLGFTRQ